MSKLSEEYVENIGCSSCGSSDSLGVYQREDGSFHGTCFSNGCHTNNPYEEENVNVEKKEGTMHDINESNINELQTRGISKEACERYGVSSIVKDGFDNVHFYPHTKQGKVSAHMLREVSDKKFTWSGSDKKQLEFFGQNVCGDGGKMIMVTEGQCDTLAAYDLLKRMGKNYRVCSIVNGASSAVKCFKDNYEWVNKFENIFLSFDQDEPGMEAAIDVAALFPPNKVKILKLSEKDANDMLVEDKQQEFLSAIYSAKEAKPDGIVSVEDIFDEAIAPPILGKSFPWETLTDVTYGYRTKEIYGVGAGSGCGKCLAKGTVVRMVDGSVKKVEDIRVGNSLLSTKDSIFGNEVLHTSFGTDEMFIVSQDDNTEYIVNSEHILTLKENHNSIIDINVKDAIGKRLYGFNAEVYYPARYTIIPPYILGIWLGDGHNGNTSVTCGDKQVIEEWVNYGLENNLVPTEYTGEQNCNRVNLSRRKGSSKGNELYTRLKSFKLPFNKHIPKEYLINSRKNRLEILAGIIDTDGYLNYTKTFYEITTKYEQLGVDIEMLARSLGFRVRSTLKNVKGKDYFRITLFGNLPTIPLRVARKRTSKRSSTLSKVSIKNIGVGEYYGFTLGNDKRFCLENYTVTHNTEAFKEMINHTIYYHKEPAGVIFLEEPAHKTLKVLAGKKVNKRFHIPSDKGGDWTIDELKDGINDLKGKVYLYNHFGSKDWESIKSKIRYMVVVLGIKDIYLDHLTALIAQEDNEYKALNKIMEDMASLVQELDCTIFYISHLRKASGTPHEEGGHVSADQFKGSGAIVYWSNFLFGIERNQQAEDVEERNTSTFVVLKDRNTGLATGVRFKLKYDHDTGRWGEDEGF